MKLGWLSITALFVCALTLAACQGEPVGRPCFIGADASSQAEGIVASPALECQSRQCLRMPGNPTDLCTAECGDSGDCAGEEASPCEMGFACMVPVTVGPFCCQKMCVCIDYLPITENGEYPTPAACDSANPINECCNLDGRRENPQYPQCG